jgi:hypothetical protein
MTLLPAFFNLFKFKWLSLKKHQRQEKIQQQDDLGCRFKQIFYFLEEGTMVENHVSAAKFMAIGLDLARSNESTNLCRFTGRYGQTPLTCENIWDDLQTFTNKVCRNNNSIVKRPPLLLLALQFLWAYPTEENLAAKFQMSTKTVWKWAALLVMKIHLLLPQKVRLAASLFVAATTPVVVMLSDSCKAAAVVMM